MKFVVSNCFDFFAAPLQKKADVGTTAETTDQAPCAHGVYKNRYTKDDRDSAPRAAGVYKSRYAEDDSDSAPLASLVYKHRYTEDDRDSTPPAAGVYKRRDTEDTQPATPKAQHPLRIFSAKAGVLTRKRPLAPAKRARTGQDALATEAQARPADAAAARAGLSTQLSVAPPKLQYLLLIT